MTSTLRTCVSVTTAELSSVGTKQRLPRRRSTLGGRRPARWSVLRGPQPGNAAQTAEPIQARLGLIDGQIVGECAPLPLCCGVIGLLHRAFAVAAAGRADRDGDAVVFGDAGEAGRDPAGLGVADRRHPIEQPYSTRAIEPPRYRQVAR